jgi:outer membrane protein assembly factor BamB
MSLRHLLVVVLAACSGSHDHPMPASSDCEPAPAPAVAPRPGPVPPGPAVRLLVRDRVVDGDGKVVASIAGIDRWAAAVPVGGDHYALGPTIADARTATTVKLPAIYDPGEGDYAIGDSFLVASPLHGELQRIDVATGAVRWKVHASPHGLTIAGDRVLATECAADGSREWSSVYSLADGARQLVTGAMPGCGASWQLTPHYFAYRPWAAPRSAVFDLAGHHAFDVEHQVIAMAELDRDLVVVTDAEIMRVSATGARAWRIATSPVAFGDTSSITTLAGGDLLVELHHRIADSGIAFWRIHPDGRVVWQATAAALGVAHSKYSNVVYSAIRGDKLFAISQASGGDFFERIDLATGVRELRCDPIGTCSAPEASVPFVIGNSLVAADGHVLHALAGVDRSEIAQPLGHHQFAVGRFEVDAARDTARAVSPPAELRTLDSDHDRNAVVGLRTDGRVAWTQPVDGVRSVRAPDLATTDTTVIASVMGTLRAFDRATGVIRWSVAADAFSLEIVDDTVYYVTCNEPTHDHWLYGVSLADGRPKFRAALADDCDPSILVDPHHVIAIESQHDGLSIVFDHAGHELYRLHEQVASMHAVAGDLVVVTDKRVARLDDTGKVVWTLPAPAATFVARAEFVELAGGDLVIGDYCAISDDGVEIQRVSPAGARRWKIVVPGLGVPHSEYLQSVYLEHRGDWLYVVSQASGGNFMERVDLATGTHRALLRP